MSRFTSMFLFPRKVFFSRLHITTESIEMKDYGLKSILEKEWYYGQVASYKSMYVLYHYQELNLKLYLAALAGRILS